MAEKTATFGIRVQAESNAKTAADGVEALKKQLESSQKAIKDYGATLRALRGNSDEVKAAKERLKGAVAAERDAISRATLELGKLGKSLGDVSKKTKEAKLPFDQLKSSVTSFKAVLAGLGIAAVAAAIYELGKTALETGLSIAKFAFESANLLRTQNLLREAATGSTTNAVALGNQIDLLSTKVPTARGELQELALDISKTFIGTRISGQGLVDTFNAVAQAGAAMGKGAGGAIESLIARGRVFGRFQLNPQELMGSGTGLAFEDVAGALAKNLKMGIAQARQALFMGRVQLDAGAKAIRDAIENRFGKINTDQMKDLNVQWQKLKDNVVNLARNVNLTPILDGVSRLGKLFSEDTVTGKGLQAAVTGFAQILGITFERGVPTAEKYIKSLTIQILKWEIGMLQSKRTLTGVVDSALKKLPSLESAFRAVRIAVDVLAGAFIGLGLRAVAALGPIGVLASIIAAEAYYIYDSWNKIDWDFLGHAIVKGLESAWDGVKNFISTFAAKIKQGFKDALGIHSPSKVFAEYGRNTAQGYRQGLDHETPATQAQVAQLASPPAINISAPQTRGRGPISVTVQVNFPNVKDGQGVKDALTGPTFMAELVKTFEELEATLGLPIQQPSGP